jgi:hypothetical protein
MGCSNVAHHSINQTKGGNTIMDRTEFAQADKILWLPQHKMTEKQEIELLNKYKQKGKQFKILKLSRIAPELYEKLSNMKDEWIWYDMLKLYRLIRNNSFVAVVFPIGTPHFNAVFFQEHGRMGGWDDFANEQEKEQTNVWVRKAQADFLFALSFRESTEKEIDGKMVKTSIFKHQRFISTNTADVNKNWHDILKPRS